MLADLGLSFFLADVLSIISMDTGVPLPFCPPSFLACSDSNGDSVCPYSPQCAIPRETPRFNNVIRV